jgi:hypothetical protein
VFELQIVQKRKKDISGLEDKIISNQTSLPRRGRGSKKMDNATRGLGYDILTVDDLF